MVSISSGEVLEFHSTEGWIRSWLGGKKGSTASATFTKYEQTCGRFLAFLCPRAASSLGSVSPADITAFRDALRAEGRKAETARELHLNRQTLYNRLARISELLGTDLDDPQTVLSAWDWPAP